MRNSLTLAAATVLLSSSAFAAGLAKTELRGNYIESRTADIYTGPCFANGEARQVGDLAIFGWNIEQGAWDGVKLDGLSVVGAVRASDTLGAGTGAYPVISVLIIDQRANPEQRLALKAFAQRMGGDLLQKVARVEYAPITFRLKDNNVHTRAAVLDAGLAEIETRAIKGTDDICHNEETFYPPLTKVDHAMPAYTLASRFEGQGLGTKWSSPNKRSAFVGSFHYEE